MDPLPFESLFGVQSTRDILYRQCLLSEVVFVPYIREDQSESCCLATQYLIFLGLNLIQATFCHIGSQFRRPVRAVVTFSLFPSLCRLKCFCFASVQRVPCFFEITVFEDSFAVTEH